MVNYFVVKRWFIIFAAVGNRCICCTHFVIVDTFCDTTKSKSLGSTVIEYFSIDRLILYKRTDSEFLTILIAQFLSDLIT